MENQDKSKELDADVIQSKADILRIQNAAAMEVASDEKPPIEQKEKMEKSIPSALRPLDEVAVGKVQSQSSPETIVPETVTESDDITAQVQDKQHHVPQFNLGERILAEQRKEASVRRQKTETSSPSNGPQEQRGIHHVVSSITAGGQSPSAENNRQYKSSLSLTAIRLDDRDKKVIADIVSSDIRRMCAAAGR